MAGTQSFAHGHRYGDLSGIIFCAKTKAGGRRKQLIASDRYIHPLFNGILDRAERQLGETTLPRLVLQWNTGEGWAAGPGASPISPADLIEFIAALVPLQPGDVVRHCAGCTAAECLCCAEAIREFIDSQLAIGAVITLEDD